MNITDPAHNKSPRDDWKILAELELPAGSKIEDIIHARLIHILKPLNLHADFVHKILKSAQEAAARAFQVDGTMKSDHIHLVIYTQPEPASNGRNWGFFRIEKTEGAADTDFQNHAIEFYLYTEGE
jgi:hypothetical protein